MKFFTCILISVLTFLLCLFPNSGFLNFEYERLALDRTAIAKQVVDAINAKDINALEAMMCLNIEQNIENLPVKIGEFCDTVLSLANGKLTDYTLDIRKDVLYTSWNRMQQDIIIINFYVGSIWYSIPVTWAICYRSPEAGIRRIALVNKTVFEIVSEICATENVA